MKVEYEQTIEDLINFGKYNYWYSIDFKYQRLKFQILYGIICCIPVFILLLYLDFKVISIIGCVVLISMLFFLGTQLAKKNQLNRIHFEIIRNKFNNSIGSRVQLEFEQSGIRVLIQEKEYYYRSNEILKIREDINYYFLYLSDISAIVIPKKMYRKNK